MNHTPEDIAATMAATGMGEVQAVNHLRITRPASTRPRPFPFEERGQP